MNRWVRDVLRVAVPIVVLLLILAVLQQVRR